MRATAWPGVVFASRGAKVSVSQRSSGVAPVRSGAGGAEEVLEERHQQDDGDAVERRCDEGAHEGAGKQGTIRPCQRQQPGGFVAHR